MKDKFEQNSYYRMIKDREAGFFFKKSDFEFEIMVAPGKIEHVVGLNDLMLKLGAGGKVDRAGYQEGRRESTLLLNKGEFDQWVSFPYKGSFPTSYLLSED